ncbi:MAG: ACT domain-containing protein [Oscillospiraceae bacterium]|nr:ACT domain-containing protein [Oscillospiraceae bacterium]
MPKKGVTKYYLVEAGLLPEVFQKVMDAKELLQTGKCATVGEAAARVGISRSAYYKYKDGVTAFQDLRGGRILTIHVLLRDETGLLSAVLGLFARCRANILTINQSLPVNGSAAVTISAETAGMVEGVEELMEDLLSLDGVLRAEIVAG